MDFLNNWLLTILIFLPCVGAFFVLLAKSRDAVRWITLGTTIVTFALSLLLFATFQWGLKGAVCVRRSRATHVAGSGTCRWCTRRSGSPRSTSNTRRHRRPVVPAGHPQHVHLHAVVRRVVEHRQDAKGYMACSSCWRRHPRRLSVARLLPLLRLLRSRLLPMYFLIGIWGGPRKEYAAIKFFLYTLVGSIGLLIVLIGTYLYTRGAPGYPTGRSTSSARRPGDAGASRQGSRWTAAVCKTFFVLLMVGFPDQGARRPGAHVAARTRTSRPRRRSA
jgi:NADH-quinone oxidoreductase subunit M